MIEFADCRRMTGEQFKLWFVLNALAGDDGALRVSFRGLAYHTGLTVADVGIALDGLATLRVNGQRLLEWRRLPVTPRATKSARVAVRLWPPVARRITVQRDAQKQKRRSTNPAH